jgi:serine carboxypeptidase 1
VATGFSYVEDKSLVVKTDKEAATDLTTLLKKLFNGNEKLQKSPLYIFAESYGGKFAVTLAVSALKAIEAGELKLQLGGNNHIFHTSHKIHRIQFIKLASVFKVCDSHVYF